MARFTLALALLSLSTTALAQAPPGRGCIDINFVSTRSTQDQQTYALTIPAFDEVATATTGYPGLSGEAVKALSLDAGVLVGRRFGVGVMYSGVDYTYPVGMGVSMPHPLFFNRAASAFDATTATFERADRSVDFYFAYIPRMPDAWRIRLFAGPTWFSVTQDMVEDIHIDQSFSMAGDNAVDITTFTEHEVKGSAWGYHVGADIAYFFSPHVGIGGVVRMNHGSVQIDHEPLTLESAKLQAGRKTIGAGLRFRF